MKRLIEEIRRRAVERNTEAAFSAGIGAGLNEAADLVETWPTIRMEAGRTPPPAPRTGMAGPQGPRRDVAGSDEDDEVGPGGPTTRPVLDLLRETGRWMTRGEIIDALQQRGHDPLPDTVQRVLAAGIRRGIIEKRRDHRYRVVP